MKKILLFSLSLILIFPLSVFAEENSRPAGNGDNEEGIRNTEPDNNEDYGIVTYGPGWIDQ